MEKHITNHKSEQYKHSDSVHRSSAESFNFLFQPEAAREHSKSRRSTADSHLPHLSLTTNGHEQSGVRHSERASRQSHSDHSRDGSDRKAHKQEHSHKVEAKHHHASSRHGGHQDGAHHSRARKHAYPNPEADERTPRSVPEHKDTEKAPSHPGESRHAVASWYHEGRKTANGERFNPDGLTVASKTLPFGTRLEVTNPANGNHVVVRVNDRGPFVKGRELDLSRGAARQLGIINQGVAHIEYKILS